MTLISTRNAVLVLTALTLSPLTARAIEVKDCPVKSMSISVRERPFDEVLLVPGSGAQNKDLYLGYIHWGQYYAEAETFFKSQKIKTRVLLAKEGGNQSVAERVSDLQNKLDDYRAQQKRVLVIGHSMGGIVARVGTRDPRFNDTVAGVLTLSTPHAGTEIADWVIAQTSDSNWLRDISNWVGFPVDDKRYVSDLSVADADKWITPYDQDSKMSPVFSVVNTETTEGFLLSNPALKLTDELLKHEMKGSDKAFNEATDGLVPARSQAAFGVCLGWVEADHGSVIGKTLNPKKRSQFFDFMKYMLNAMGAYGVKSASASR